VKNLKTLLLFSFFSFEVAYKKIHKKIFNFIEFLLLSHDRVIANVNQLPLTASHRLNHSARIRQDSFRHSKLKHHKQLYSDQLGIVLMVGMLGILEHNIDCSLLDNTFHK
jgi:hypothetical protein